MSIDLQPTTEQLTAWDRQYVWHAFTQMQDYQPLIFERGEGCALFDIHGNRYLDGCSSLWCNIHGHCHPRIDAAIREQLDKVAHVTNLGASNPTTIELAKRLVEITPEGLNHAFFVSDGACAIEAALKIAFQYWRQCDRPQPEKSAFLTLGDAYHGDTIGSVSLGGVDRFNAVFGPLLFETIRAPMPDLYRLPEGVTAENACTYYLGEVEKILAAEHHRLAAMVIEPLVQGAAGMVMHPPGFLRGVRELTRKYNVLLIADEVAVGFGRTGTMFACEQEEVTPDLLCLGKGLTGGYLPVAATLATDEVYNAFLGDYEESKAFFHGHTYGGNPLGCAAGLATLDIFEEDRTLEQLPPKIERLAEHLDRLSRHEHVGDVRQRGLMAGIELVRDKQTKEPFPWKERRAHFVCERAMDDGVYVRPLGNVLILMPPLAISLEELDQICLAVERGIEETL